MTTAEPTPLQIPRSGWQTPWLSPSSILHGQDWSDVTPQQPLEPPQTPEEREGRLIALRICCNPLLRGLALSSLLVSALLSALVGLAAPHLHRPQAMSWWILELLQEVAHV